MATLEIACAVEGDYAYHSAAMLHSVLANRGGLPVRVHYLHGPDFSKDIESGLSRMVEREPGCSVSFRSIDDRLCEGLPTRGFTGKATWYRIFLPDLLPDIDRVLCLDVDLIVVDSLAGLWATEIDDALVAAVTNVLAPMYMERPAELGLDPRAYFNAGVMLLNLKRMREESSAETLRRFAIAHAPELVLRDQDALNFVLASNRCELHPRWNAMNALRVYPWASYVFSPQEISEARSQPAVRHFEGPGPNKPWHYLGDRDAKQLYAAHRRATPWPVFRLEGRTPRNVARRQLRRVRRWF